MKYLIMFFLAYAIFTTAKGQFLAFIYDPDVEPNEGSILFGPNEEELREMRMNSPTLYNESQIDYSEITESTPSEAQKEPADVQESSDDQSKTSKAPKEESPS